MFPPSSPLIERVRVQNEKKQFEQAAKAGQPNKLLKSFNFLNGKSEENAVVRRLEPCAAENV